MCLNYTYYLVNVSIRVVASSDFFCMLLLNRRDDDWFAALGKSCIHMTWTARGAISLEVQQLLILETTLLPSFSEPHYPEITYNCSIFW